MHLAFLRPAHELCLGISEDPEPGVAIAGQDDGFSVAHEGLDAPEVVALRVEVTARG